MGHDGGSAVIRIVVSSQQIQEKRIHLTPDQTHYLFRVMRLHPGDHIEALLSGQSIYRCGVTQDPHVVDCLDVREALEPNLLYLAQALIKKDLFSQVVEKGTEAGLAGFYPLITERTIVRDVSASKWNRWRTIAQEATEQAHRSVVPELFSAVSISDVIQMSASPKLLLDPGGRNIWDWLASHQISCFAHGLLVVGPEGGLTAREQGHLIKAGFEAVSLGPYVYRAENAGVFAAAVFTAWLSSERRGQSVL